MLTIQIFFTLWHISWLSIPTAYNSLQSSIVSLRGTSWFNKFLNVLCGHLGYLRHPPPYLSSHIVSDEKVLWFHFSGFKEQELRHLSYWLDGFVFKILLLIDTPYLDPSLDENLGFLHIHPSIFTQIPWPEEHSQLEKSFCLLHTFFIWLLEIADYLN